MKTSTSSFIVNAFTLSAASLCGVVLYVVAKRTSDGLSVLVLDISLYVIVWIVVTFELIKQYNREVKRDWILGAVLSMIGAGIAVIIDLLVLFVHCIFTASRWLMALSIEEFEIAIRKANDSFTSLRVYNDGDAIDKFKERDSVESMASLST